MDTNNPCHGKSGQATVELAMGLIAILAVVGTLVQFGLLGVARLETRVAATGAAAERSMDNLDGLVYVPTYLQEVAPGTDGRSFTEDDVFVSGNLDQAHDDIAGRMLPGLAGTWDPDSPIAEISNSLRMMEGMGFVQATSFDFNVPVLPVVRALVFGVDRVDVGTEVWMTKTGDLY